MKKTISARPYPGAILNPRNDKVFKAIFTGNSKESEFALKSFLSAVIGKEVVKVQLYANELPAPLPEEKNSSFDISVVFNDGERAEIEMQGKNREDSFNDRIVFLASRLMTFSVKSGETYKDVRNIYQISVMNFCLKKDGDIVSTYKLRSPDHEESLSEKLTIITLELPKISRLKDFTNLSKAEMWAIFFKEADNPEHQEILTDISQKEEGIMAAQTVLSKMSAEEQLWLRLKREKVEMDRRSLEQYYREKAETKEQELKAQEQELKAQEKELKAQEKELKAQEKELKAQEQELKAQEQEIKAKEKEIENLKRIAEKNNKNMQATIKLLVEKGIPQEIIDSIKNM